MTDETDTTEPTAPAPEPVANVLRRRIDLEHRRNPALELRKRMGIIMHPAVFVRMQFEMTGYLMPGWRPLDAEAHFCDFPIEPARGQWASAIGEDGFECVMRGHRNWHVFALAQGERLARLALSGIEIEAMRLIAGRIA